MGDVYAGTTIELPKTSGATPHLWVVLTDPDGNPAQVVIANLTTRKADSDDTVVLNVGDHSYIKHETIVYYADARLATVEGIEKIAQFPNYGYHDDCSDELLGKIQQGLLTSRYTPKKVKDYCIGRFSKK
jgi:hypothetical protein